MQKYLVFKKDGEDGPDVKGGELNALIVHASRVQKISENGRLIAICVPDLCFPSVAAYYQLEAHQIFHIFHTCFSLFLSFDLVNHTRYHTLNSPRKCNTHAQNYLLVWSKMVQSHLSSQSFCFSIFVHTNVFYTFPNFAFFCGLQQYFDRINLLIYRYFQLLARHL